jgi:tetratricopeptide (TPR) repeat protein
MGPFEVNMTWFNFSLLLCLFAVISQPALSQQVGSDCPPKPENAEAARKFAGSWFGKGEKLVDEQRDQEALEAFNCSLRMVEHPATLFNAGQAARLVGKHTEALKLLRRYVELAPRDPMSDKAKKIISELENVGEDENKQEELQTPPEALRQEQGEAGEHDMLTSKTEVTDKKRSLLTAGYVSLGLGAAGVVTGTVLQILAGKTALNDGSEADDYDEYRRLDDDRKSYQIGAVIGFAVGGAALGAGLTMILIAKKGEKEKSSDARISLVPGPGSVSIVGRF